MSHKMKLPKLPDWMPPDMRLVAAIEASAEKHGVPLAAIEAVYADIMTGYMVPAGEAAISALQRASTEGESILRDRGVNLESARQAMKQVGLDLDEHLHDPNLVERFAQVSERLTRSTPQPTTFNTNSSGATTMTTENAGPSVADLKLKLTQMQADPAFLEILKSAGAHPLYKHKMAERQAIIDRLAAAEALQQGEGPPPRGAGDMVGDLRQQLARLVADPEFKKEFHDPSHRRHRARAREREDLIGKLAAAERAAEMGRPGRSTTSIREDIDKLSNDPSFLQSIGDKRNRGYRESTQRHGALVKELASTEAHEAAANAVQSQADVGGE